MTLFDHPLRSLLLIAIATAAALLWAQSTVTPEHIYALGYAWVVVALIDAPLVYSRVPSSTGVIGGEQLAVRWPPYKRDAWIAITCLVLVDVLLGIDTRFVYAGGPPPPGKTFPPLHTAIVAVMGLSTLAFWVFSFRCWLVGRKRRYLSRPKP